MKKEENKRSSKSEETLNVKRFLRKRWVVPALYLVAAAGVLSSIFFLQGQDESASPDNGVEVTESSQGNDMYPYGENAIEVTTTSEIIKLPVEEESDVTIIGNFYDVNGTEEEQQKALVYYDNTYFPSNGIDLAHAEGESFDVVASLSGTISKAEKDALLGYVVEMTHDNDVVTHYHSLEELTVEVGSTVAQGEVLGRAGRSIYNEEAGIHVHFEIRQDGVAMNPNDVFQQPIDFMKDESGEKEDEVKETEDQPSDKEDEKENTTDEKAPPEEKPAEDSNEKENQLG